MTAGSPPVVPDLTPEGTHVRLSLAKVVAIVSVLVTGTVYATVWVVETLTDIKHHVRDDDRHVPVGFSLDHGRLVGAWDLQRSITAMEKAGEEFRQAVEGLTRSPIHFDECTMTGRTVTCRWRH